MSERAAAPATKVGGVRNLILAAGVVLLLAGVALVAAGPVLFRAGSLDLETATAGLGQAAFYAFAAAGIAGLAGILFSLPAKSHRGAIVGVLVLVAAGMGAGTLFSQTVTRGQFPPIHDVQTDWGQPVAFTERTLQDREAAGAVRIRDDASIPQGEGKWAGKSFAAAQGEFYRDLKPLFVDAAPADATVAAAEAAKRLGWDVMLSDPPAGVMEAVHHTRWYGLTADISVRVVPDGEGSRIDARSTSRIAGPDMGANASRVTQLLGDIAFALRGT